VILQQPGRPGNGTALLALPVLQFAALYARIGHQAIHRDKGSAS
jgi:hypothetical protein